MSIIIILYYNMYYYGYISVLAYYLALFAAILAVSAAVLASFLLIQK